jgi:hypothetical protein
MSVQKAVCALLLAILSFVVGVEVYFLHYGSLQLSDAWFSLLLVSLGCLCLLFRPQLPAVPIVSLLLASFSVLYSQIDPAEIAYLGGLSSRLGSLLWSALRILFPFVFIHFSLVFPLRSEWVDRDRYRLAFLYLPYIVLLTAIDLRILGEFLPVVIMLVGFAVGLGIFIRNYRVSLTPAEKNRLRLVLIGSLAGAVPRILTYLAAGQLPSFADYISHFFLLPLFPVCLVFAVVKENLSEVSRAFQKVLVYSMVIAGLVAGLFFSSLFVAWFISDSLSGSSRTVITLSVPLALAYPLWRWASSYVKDRFLSVHVMERVRRDSSIEYKPIRPNPFIVGNPVRDPEMFFGRREEFEFLRDKIRNQREGSIIVLTGERRTGKSSILYQVMNGSLGEEYVSVFLDMQGLVVEDDLEFLDAMASEITKSVPANEENRYEVYRRAETPHIAFTSFVDAAIERIGQRNLLLLFDEYELIEDKIGAGKLSKEIPNYLNSMLERQPHLSLIFTGSRAFEAKDLWSGLLGKSFYREVSFLNRKDAQQLISRPFAGAVVFRKGIIEKCLRLTNGHPFFTQLLGQTMVDVVNEREDPVVDRTVLREVVRRVIEHPTPQLLYHWSGLTGSEKLVLSSLATLLRSDHDYASSERVEQVIESVPANYRRDIDLVQTRMLLEQLRSRRLLDRDQIRYRFSMDLIRRWVRTEQSVWNVLGQVHGTGNEQ